MSVQVARRVKYLCLSYWARVSLLMSLLLWISVAWKIGFTWSSLCFSWCAANAQSQHNLLRHVFYLHVHPLKCYPFEVNIADFDTMCYYYFIVMFHVITLCLLHLLFCHHNLCQSILFIVFDCFLFHNILFIVFNWIFITIIFSMFD